ncbi:MAG TPA: glycosyltransferase family 2 protein [Steroidobacteraceae bacterium]|nr:glycosyltransferase family 2 protein [Steroidobacteraceae bacterium]
MPVSVLILTLDEEVNIVDCLASVAWSDDVVVLDSGSADRTRELAIARGARIVVRPFDDYARQRNFGLGGIEYRHPWILMLDADERVPEDLAAEVRHVVAGAGEELALFYMRRRDYLFGRWIRRSSGYPTWFGRLVRRGRVRIERPFNEQSYAQGRSAQLAGHLDHYPFNKGFTEWLAKHNRYSSMEAQLLEQQRGAPGRESIFDRDPVVRRRAIKDRVYRLPARPLLTFLALYLARGGFLEGRAGLTFSLLRAWYEFMIDCKRRELRRRACDLPV